MSSTRTLLYDDSGFDYVKLGSNQVSDVIRAILDRNNLAGKVVPMLVTAKLNLSQCQEVLTALPYYNRCFQESGDLIMVD